MMKKPDFLHVDTKKKNIGVGMVKNGCDHSVLRTLKLAACQREKMDGIN